MRLCLRLWREGTYYEFAKVFLSSKRDLMPSQEPHEVLDFA